MKEVSDGVGSAWTMLVVLTSSCSFDSTRFCKAGDGSAQPISREIAQYGGVGQNRTDKPRTRGTP